ncbi:PilZ domain-containing protein [Alteromonadaceae bacterium 2753L.S.0a.02]|nr:PilZ domain-containing protein [Alteromonadaceae bacterium 2753L.S.0a.02]
MTDNIERRRYTRVDFDTEATLIQGNHQWQSSLVDISLNGLLINTPPHYKIDVEQQVEVRIPLADDAEIQMQATLAHSSSEVLGFKCVSIDLESVAHLRRLVELNIGEANAAERVLAELLCSN